MGLFNKKVSNRRLTPAKKYKFFKRLGYEPNPGQVKFHNSDARFRIVSAASRVGKSTGAAFEAMAYAHLPNKMIWTVGPTYNLSEKVFRIIWRKLVEELRYDTVAKSRRDRYIKFPWGTEIWGMSAHTPENLLGEGVDLLVVDEASRIRSDVWNEYMRERLIDKIGHALIISSPKGSGGWFPELFRRGQAKEIGHFSVSCSLFDNPRIPKEELEELLRVLPKEAYDQEVLGKFVPYGGLVYKEWKEEIHVSKAAEFIPGVPVLLAVDFGTRNPCVVLFVQQIGENLFNVFDEYYERNHITLEHATNVRASILRMLKASGHETITMYHDPSGLDQSNTFRLINPELVTIGAVNDVVPGINTVGSHMKYNEYAGRPGLLIHPRCSSLIWEMGLYHYPKTRTILTGESENPVPVDDHALDALRYLLHTMAPISSLQVLVDHFDAGFSEPSIVDQEAGRGYISDIARLKSAVLSETE